MGAFDNLTNQQALDQADPNNLPNLVNNIELGSMLTPIKATITGLSAVAAVDITSAAVQAAAVVNAGPSWLVSTGSAAPPQPLPPIQNLKTLRVTAVGTGATGPRVLTDAGGTAVAPSTGIAGVALISDDGKTLTFEGTVTGFIIEYFAQSAQPMTSQFPG